MRQLQALSVLLSGANVFLTGAPGAGKTFVLNEYIRRATHKGLKLAVTASTGIAATHIGGTTIHGWSGLGLRDSLSEHDLEWLAANERLTKRYNSTDVLIIDEVSMLHGSRLNMVNQAAQLLRGNDKPFGGIQVVLVGDLFQLPPVTRGPAVADFVQHSQAWHDLDLQICYITEQHRQENDGLLELLSAMRANDFDQVHFEYIQSRMHTKSEDSDAVVTRLYTHNADVDTINAQHLRALPGNSKTYNMASKGPESRVEALKKGLLVPSALQLRVGAEVMFVANNFAEGFVNGTRGQVIDFSGHWPVVQLHKNNRKIIVEPHSWNITEDGRVKAEVAQLPLRLAWAITIHKSQGMSLDAAEIDLSRAFTPGMGYVALSRVRSLDGVYLQGINPQALQLHPDVHEFDRYLKQASSELSSSVADAPEFLQENAVEEDSEILDALRAWRSREARDRAIAPYMVMHDASLTAIARRMPENLRELSSVKGFGPVKLDLYGDAVLTVLADFRKT